MNPIIATGSVIAHASVRRNDPNIRLFDYRAALFLWITESPFNPIVYADASDDLRVCTKDHYSLAARHGKTLIARSFDLANLARNFGKGRAEARLLREVLAEFSEWESFTKVTGRLFIGNCGGLSAEAGVVKFSRGNFMPHMVDTRFFRVSRSFFEENLLPLENEINDVDPLTYIESVWGRAVRQFGLDEWSEPLQIIGVHAS
jgi:hypothetical protein